MGEKRDGNREGKGNRGWGVDTGKEGDRKGGSRQREVMWERDRRESVKGKSYM